MELTDSWYIKLTQVSEDILGQELPLSDRSVSELRGEAGLEKQRGREEEKESVLLSVVFWSSSHWPAFHLLSTRGQYNLNSSK